MAQSGRSWPVLVTARPDKGGEFAESTIGPLVGSLPAVLIGGSRLATDELHANLAAKGHPDATPNRCYAIYILARGSSTVAELGQRLGVTRQAASATVRGLETAGYAYRDAVGYNRRMEPVQLTARGDELAALIADNWARIVRSWVDILGEDRLRTVERDLALLLFGQAHA